MKAIRSLLFFLSAVVGLQAQEKIPYIHYNFNDANTSTTVAQNIGSGWTALNGTLLGSNNTAAALQNVAGVSGQAGDYAFNNSAATMGGAGGSVLLTGFRAAVNNSFGNHNIKSITISMWFQATDGPIAETARLFSVTGQSEQLHTMNNGGSGGVMGRLGTQIGGSSYANSDQVYGTTGKWTFVAITIDLSKSTNNVLYYIGDKYTSAMPAGMGTINDADGFWNIANNLRVGKYSDTAGAFKGYIDDFRIYLSRDTSAALSLAEVEQVRLSAFTAILDARRRELFMRCFGLSESATSLSEIDVPITGNDRINLYGAYSGPLLIFGIHLSEANAVLREVAEWFDRPHPRGRDLRGEVDFAAIELARVYIALKNSPNLEAATRTAIVRFFTEYDFASIYGSENHALLFHASRYLMANQLPQHTFQAYGKTGAQLEQEDLQWLKQFIRFRAREGWGEFDSADYTALVINAMLTLADYAPDQELVELCTAMANVVLADVLVDMSRGLYGGARARIAEGNALVHGQSTLNDLLYLYFGIADFKPDSGQKRLLNSNRLTRWETFNSSLTSSFRPLPIVEAIALDRTFPYENRERKHLHDMADTLPENPLEGSIRKLTLVEDDFLLGTIQLQDAYPANTSISSQRYAKHQQVEWDFTITSGLRTRIFTHHPGNSDTHSYWRGSNSISTYVQTFQNKTAVLGRWDIPESSAYHYIHAYLPVAEFDEVLENGGWIFARKGDVYAALWFSDGYERVRTGENANREFISRGLRKASVFECGHARDFGSFAAFRSEILTNVVSFNKQSLKLSYNSARAGTISIESDGTRMVNGAPVDLNYPTYSSPYMQSPWKSGVITFSVGGRQPKVMDFNTVPFTLGNESFSFDDWLSTFPGIPANKRDSLDDASGNGRANILKFLLGNDPSSGDLPPVFEAEVDMDGEITFLFRTAKIAASVDFVVQATHDLTAFEPGIPAWVVLVDEDDDFSYWQVVAEPVEEDKSVFVRLVISNL